jgi:hypothetical protein
MKRRFEIYFNSWKAQKYTIVLVEINEYGESKSEYAHYDTYEQALTSVQYAEGSPNPYGVKVYGN